MGVLMSGSVAASWLNVDLQDARRGKENLRGLVMAARSPDEFTETGRGLFVAMMSDVDVYDSSAQILKDAAGLDEFITGARRDNLSPDGERRTRGNW